MSQKTPARNWSFDLSQVKCISLDPHCGEETAIAFVRAEVGSIGHRIIELLVAFVFRTLLHSWAPVLLIFLCISS